MVVRMGTFNLHNTAPTTFGNGTLVRLRSGMDPIWQGHLETNRDRIGGRYPSVYTLKTWDQVGPNQYRHGSTYRTVEVVRPKDGTGWCLRLWGEDQDERYASKGEAQRAAEELVLA
jgi:hypothetical protein